MDEHTTKIIDASELIRKLKEERLLVYEERRVIQNLNEKVCTTFYINRTIVLIMLF